MIISWDWLNEYVTLDVSREQIEQRLMMAGLNHEGTETVGGDIAIELEVTSNRADCLGHLGVAREVAVLFGRPLSVPDPQPKVKSRAKAASKLVSVAIEDRELCPRYTARVVRGVKVGPSPDWLVKRLATVGQKSVNNVVDVTNYVLMECGQPLHAFDLAKLDGGKIIVRRATKEEKFEAIDHNAYELDERMCVIADSSRPVAIAGVMGGAESEVSESTVDLLIESAAFSPLAVRSAARTLSLHSPSSFRFERSPDPEMVDWASRRCCELILQVAGGELCAGVVDVGEHRPNREPITLRLPRIERLLGVRVPTDEVRRILTTLGCEEQSATDASVTVVPPSWRADLSREVDLIEEVARVHGYDQIPEDVAVPMAASAKRGVDRVAESIRTVLVAAGFDEAMTASVVTEEWSHAFSPWTDAAPLATIMPMLRGANHLRRSLVPSVLAARRYNESLNNPVIQLYEVAHVYLPRAGQLPDERLMLALVAGGDYFQLKGVIEAMLARLNPVARLEVVDAADPLFAAGRCGELRLDGQRLGFLGEVSADGAKRFQLRSAAVVAELDVTVLVDCAHLVPTYAPLSAYPTVARDVNFVVDESVRWSALAETIERAAGALLETLDCTEVYRDEQRLGAGKKSLVAKLVFRRDDATLTSEEADQMRDRIVAACRDAHGAELRA